MDIIASFIQSPLTPSIAISLLLSFVGHYYETKPHVILLGILGLFLVHFLSITPGDKIIQSDVSALREENEGLKNNLMQVYAMVQEQTQNASGPPPPIPPSMTGVSGLRKDEEDDDGKPYL